MFRTIVVVLAASAALWSTAWADTLDRVRDRAMLKIGYREDAAPFAYKDRNGQPAGYSVDLCRAVTAQIKQQLELKELSIAYVPVTAENRFKTVQRGEVDLLCGATTVTLSRRELVDFSLPTFVDGAGVMVRAGGPRNFRELAGQKVGVHAGTTTEGALGNTIKRFGIEIDTVRVKDHADGLEKLRNGEITAYFADRAILFFLSAGSGTPEKFYLSERQFTYEPYALALQRGDSEFRLAVDRALSRIYRSGRIAKIFTAALGATAKPSRELTVLYRLGSLVE